VKLGEKVTQDDFDTAGGHARLWAAESSLAWARLCLFEGARGGGVEGDPGSVLGTSLAASGAIEEELRFVEGPGDAVAAVALLPNALSHARANALHIFTTSLSGGTEKEIEEHFSLVRNATSSSEDVLRRAFNSQAPTGGESLSTSLQPSRYLHLRAITTLASANQNMAVARLLSALPHILAPMQEDRVGAALSRLTSAREHLGEALVSLGSVLASIESALASGGGKAVKLGSEPTTNESLSRGCWERLAWDVRRAKTEVRCFQSEVDLLTALGSVWLFPGGEDRELGKKVASPTAGAPPPLFPLSEADRTTALPVLRNVHKSVGECFKEYASFEAQRARFCEAGIDAGLGKSRALRMLGLLSCIEGVSVTAEGAFRGVIDDYTSLLNSLLSINGKSGVSGASGITGNCGVRESGTLWEGQPLLFQAHLASTLHAYGGILKQWEKREGEAKAIEEGALGLWKNCVSGWGIQSPGVATLLEGGGGARTFLAQRVLSAALCGPDIGSWGMGLSIDLSEL